MRGERDNFHFGLGLMYCLRDRQAAEVRQRQSQQDDVGPELADGVDGLGTGASYTDDGDVVYQHAQVWWQALSYDGVVIHDQDAYPGVVRLQGGPSHTCMQVTANSCASFNA